MGVRLLRVIFVTILAVLVFAGLTYAAQQTAATQSPQVSTPAPASTTPQILVVPDVHGQAFVFAKGIIQDAGFAWHVTGSVGGYAVDTVATQRPEAGTQVVDTGAPVLTLTLARNPHYKDHGQPENDSPYPATALRLAPVSAGLTPLPATPTRTPQASPKVVKPAAKPAVKPVTKPNVKTAVKAGARPPAFVVKGAPKEPLDEIPLTQRAMNLSVWLATHNQPTSANVSYWLYQHSWIVTGAKFGWWHGAQALRTLIIVDQRVEKQWGIGTASELTARKALATVKARSS
jgi:PASTA domain